MTLDELLATDALIPSMPEAVALVLIVLQRDEPDMRRVNSLLASEGGLTVRLLRLVNSARYSRGSHRIGSVDAATALIGLNATRQMVSAAAVGGAFRGVPGVDLTEFWRFSLDVAKLSESLAEELGMDRSVAFTAGLLHGVGDLVMKMAMPERASLKPAFEAADDRHAAQMAELGYAYPQVGAAFAERWHFPDAIVDAISKQCDLQEDGDGETLASVLYLAVWSARAHELDIDGDALFDQFPQAVADSVGLTDSDWLRSTAPIEWTKENEARDFHS